MPVPPKSRLLLNRCDCMYHHQQKGLALQRGVVDRVRGGRRILMRAKCNSSSSNRHPRYRGPERCHIYLRPCWRHLLILKLR